LKWFESNRAYREARIFKAPLHAGQCSMSMPTRRG
jgi:hypothetical protein